MWQFGSTFGGHAIFCLLLKMSRWISGFWSNVWNILHFLLPIFHVNLTIFPNFSCYLTIFLFFLPPSKKGLVGSQFSTSNWRTFWRTIVKMEDLEDKVAQWRTYLTPMILTKLSLKTLKWLRVWNESSILIQLCHVLSISLNEKYRSTLHEKNYHLCVQFYSSVMVAYYISSYFIISVSN